MDNIINIIIKKKIFRLGLPIRKWIHMFYGKIRNVLTNYWIKSMFEGHRRLVSPVSFSIGS